MKAIKSILLSISIAVFLTAATMPQNDFEDGWEDGHCEGWKDVRGQFTTCPVAPVAPVPGINQDSYRGGYNAGFKRGIKDANE